MLKGLPTLLVVTTVALAIWIVAEAESVRTEAFAPVLAIDAGASGGFMARADPDYPWPGRVSISAEGSAGALDALRRTLEQGVMLSPGRGLRREAGVYSVDLREALESLDSVDATGATIAAVDPPAVSVEVAERDSRQVQVSLMREGLSLESDPLLSASSVTITGPKRFIDMLTDQSRALVRLRPDDLRRLIPGQAELISGVRVELPAEIPAQEFWGASPMSPAAIDVTVTLRAQVRELKISSVSVLLAVAPVDYNDWDVEVDDQHRFIKDVVLIGPSDLIGQFERGERRVDAIVRLTFEDLEAGVAAGTLSREAQIGPLPPGVTARCEDASVEMVVHPRAQSRAQDDPEEAQDH